jgi:hypothetical protein
VNHRATFCLNQIAALPSKRAGLGWRDIEHVSSVQHGSLAVRIFLTYRQALAVSSFPLEGLAQNEHSYCGNVI